MPGNIAMSALVVIAWGYMIYTGSISSIWPMFGVANQLLAAIALGVGTTHIIKSGKLKYSWVTLVPMSFMFVTTLTAAWKLIFMFLAKASASTIPADRFNFNLDALLMGFMALLALIVLTDMLCKWYGYISGTRMIKTTEVTEYDA
jgi:carbon starvation protein